MRKWFLLVMGLLFQVYLFAQEDEIDSLFFNIDTVAESLVDTLAADKIEKKEVKTVLGNELEYDRLFISTGDSLTVKIHRITLADVQYRYPFNYVIQSVDKAEVYKIEYSYGKIEIINEGAKYIPKTVVTWEDIGFTDNKDEVIGLVSKGPISARSDGKKIKTSTDLLKNNAKVILAKKAINLGAEKVYISNIYIHKAYGELPYVLMEAEAYGEPEE